MSEQNVGAPKEMKTDLVRGMKTRHLGMIAIGGAIGTGLWFASGRVISTIGPGGALLVFVAMGFLVYFLMTSLGEMATKVPLSGSFATYANKFIDPAAGFAIGWNYYLSWAVTVTFEIIVGVTALQYWFPPDVLPSWIPSVVFFFLLFGLNFASAKVFGESEYWFSSLKVITVIIFLFIGLLLIIGVIGPGSPGGANWVYEGVDANGDVAKAPFITGPGPIFGMFLIAAFSFQGTELIGLSAGEAENPEKTIPKAINSVFWRILLFYVLAMIVVGTLIPFDNAHIMASNDVSSTDVGAVAYSPFTLVFAEAGFGWAAHFMNFVFLTSVLSCGNSGLFCATRMLYGMGNEGKAPKIFSQTNKRGVPVVALLVTAAIAGLGFFTYLLPVDPFDILLNASGMMGMFGWLAIAITHWRFRAAYTHQGYRIEDLKYKAKFYPVGPVVGTILCIMVVIASEFWVFTQKPFVFADMAMFYWPLPVIIILYFGYKIVMKTKIIPLDQVKFTVEYEKTVKGE